MSNSVDIWGSFADKCFIQILKLNCISLNSIKWIGAQWEYFTKKKKMYSLAFFIKYFLKESKLSEFWVAP